MCSYCCVIILITEIEFIVITEVCIILSLKLVEMIVTVSNIIEVCMIMMIILTEVCVIVITVHFIVIIITIYHC